MATVPEKSASAEKDALLCQANETPMTDTTDVLTCEECGSKFTNPSYFHDHRRWHSHVRKQQAATMKSALGKDHHTLSSSTGISESIKVENQDDSEYLAAHALLKPFACEYCGWRFVLKKDLVHHVRTHTGEKPYECPECGKRFARAHSLNQHKRIHEGLPQTVDYQTPPKQPGRTDKQTANDVTVPVETTGTSAFEISPPIAANQENPPDFGTAPSCGYQQAGTDGVPSASNTQAGLLIDSDTSLGEAPSGIHGGGKRGVRFTCQFCGWGFWDRKDKRQHEWTHTGYKPYKCSMCDKTFSRTYSRTLHMRTHSGERPYPCQHCDKTFPSPSSLRSHENVHTKIRRHKCTMCAESFKKMADFKEHQLEHLSNEPGLFATSYTGNSEVTSVTNEDSSSTSLPFPVSISFAQLSGTSQNLTERNSSDSSRQLNPTGVMDQSSDSDRFAGPVQHNITNDASVSQSLNLTTKQRQTDVVPSVNTYSSLLSGLLKNKRDVRFYCKHCEKGFHTKKECHQHETSHTQNKPFECSICGKILSSRYLLKMHVIGHAGKSNETPNTNEQSYMCELCEETFSLVVDFTDHLQLHQNEDPARFIQYYPDGFNPESQKASDLVNLSPLASNAINVAQTALYSAAPISDTGLIQPQTAKRRNASTPRKKPGRVPQTGKGALRFGCSFCTRRFRCKKDWRQHENTHTGLKPYTCTVCGKKLSRHYTLKVHMLTHTGQKPISCSHCDKSFRVKSRLRTHERIHHAALCNPTLHNKCDLCQMAFKELSDLENHIRVGHDDVVRMMAKNFFNSTPVTSALFMSSSTSENPTQKLSVSSDEPYQEEITCTVRYISKRNRIIDPVAANAIDSWLEGNKVSGQARFMCHFCGKGFHNARDWQQHENTHTGYKPYACDICGKKLSRLHSLKAHKLRHLKGHPNVCQFYKCGKRFKEEAELDDHMKSHQSSFQCIKCQVCFETVVELEIHMAEHDKEKEGQDSAEYQQVPSGPFFFKGNGQSSEKEKDSHSSGTPKKKEPFKPTPGTIRYQCSFCGWRTEDFDIFKRHKIWHRRRKNKAGQMKKSCNKCGAAFVTNEKLEIHLRTCGFLCSLCRKPFKTKSLLEEHLKRHSEAESTHKSAENECIEEVSIVPLSETSGQDLLRGLSNVAVVSQETRSSPPEGQMNFNILESLLSRKNSTETADVASKAHKTFLGHNERKQSKKFVHATCRLCQKRFSHGYALKLHMVLHISETPYKCKNCAKRFRSKDTLREHQNINLACSQGSIRPSTSTKVQVVPRAAETATQLKKDSILYRQLKLGSPRDGRISKNKDTQQKPHQCSYCGWGFWLKKDCVVHERIHTGEKPYVCQTCGKSFARSYSLKLHNMTHSGVKPFHCRVCNKGFYCRGNVNAHERIHTSAKPNLNCKWCGVPFRSRSGLKKHEKLRHSQEVVGNASSMNTGSISTNREVEILVQPVNVIKSVAADSLQNKSKSGVCSFCGWNFHNVERMRRHLYWHRKRYFGTFRKHMKLKELNGSNALQKREGKMFKCTTCNATFHHPAVLKLHGKSHSSEQLYYCDCCPLKFDVYTEFSRHKALHHSRFACLYCDKFIDGSQELVRHKKACRARKLRLFSGNQSARKVSLRCRRCKVTFRGPNAMRLHISRCHSTAHYASCFRCQKGFTSHEEFMRHLLRGCSSPDSRISKPVATSKQMGYNQDYMSVETNPITPEVSMLGQIPYPDKSFKVSNVSRIVSSSEAVGWAQTEDVPSEGPQNIDDQLSHLVHTGLDFINKGASTSKLFQCPYCTSSFAQSFGLKQHVRIHTGEKPFICRECGRAFAQKINLNQHMATHSEEKPFKCQHCGKCFSRKVQIKRHLERMHSKELPYSCGQCPRSFKSVDELKRHCIVHFGKRQHACKYCGWTFAEKRDMVNHERVHTGEKPFSCKVCDMSFARTYSLKVHMRSHTGEKPHKCDVCSKGCSSAYNLKLHLKTHEKQQTLAESPMVKFWTENSQT